MKPDFNIENHMERHAAHDCAFYREWRDRMTWRAPCSYCNVNPAVHMDHVVPLAVLKRSTEWPDWALEKTPACKECNWRKLTRLLIPPSWSHRLDELNDLGVGKFRVWDGSVEALRETVK